MRRAFLIILLATLFGQVLPAQKTSGQVDSVVSLLSAQSAQLIQKNGVDYRKVTGPARFFHNNTYLICDTALMNVNRNIIDAWGHVKILQNETVLTGDSLKYIVDSDLAQFRGHLVQLEDKEHNVLRTRHLDYNTKDSVAVFRNGGAMRDKDGQLIESRNGTYDSKIKTFTFTDNVNMFTDSVFVKTTRMIYQTDLGLATFGTATDAWRDDYMLSSDAGWYDRPRELFLFNKKVHGLSPDKEVWSDSLYYYRATRDIDLRGNVQLTDSTRKTSALGGRAFYTDSLMRVVLTRDPAIIGVVDTTGTSIDTVYMAADEFIYRTRYLGDLSSGTVSASRKRVEDINQDAVMTYRRKAAEDARKAAEEAKKAADEANGVPPQPTQQSTQQEKLSAKGSSKSASAQESAPETEAPPQVQEAPPATPPAAPPTTPPEKDTKASPADSLANTTVPPVDTTAAPKASLVATIEPVSVKPDSTASGVHSVGSAVIPDTSGRDSQQQDPDPQQQEREDGPILPSSDTLSTAVDSLAAAADSLVAPKVVDSTQVAFLSAIRNVRLYREDIQVRCDSLEYTQLDSLIRAYKDPVIWNEGNRQYSSDSLIVVVKDNALKKASLMSNAFVIIEEAPNLYDQIRSTEMLAYFGEGGGLERFDALGDASTVFYLQEDSVFATVNKAEAKMLYAMLKDGSVDRVYYFDSPKSDAYPLAQLRQDERVLKGFNYRVDEMIRTPDDVTTLRPRKSQRKQYEARPKATYPQSEIYFPGYFSGIYKEIADREALKEYKRTHPEEFAPRDTLAVGADSLVAASDSLLVSAGDSLSVGRDSTLSAVDSLSRTAPTPAVSDSTSVARDSLSTTAAQPRVPTAQELKKAQKEAQKKAKEEERLRKIERKEAIWAQKDSIDAAKARAKLEKKQEKARKKTLKALQKQKKQEAKDARRLERYKARYEKQKAREEEAAAKKAAKKAAKTPSQPEAVEGGQTQDNPPTENATQDPPATQEAPPVQQQEELPPSRQTRTNAKETTQERLQ